MALLGTHRLRAIDQPSRPDALAAGRLAVEQPKSLRPSVTPRAHELRPEATVCELPHSHADPIFDAIVTESGKRRYSAARDVALRYKGRDANHRQIVDRALHSRELSALDTCVYFAVHPARRSSRVFRRAAVDPKPTSFQS